MPRIKPFNGIRPNPDYADEVVLDIENLSLQEAKLIRQENPYSYVNMLVPRLDNLFLRGSKNELAFKKINENFEEFLEKGVLVRDARPSIYVYRISRNGIEQTGIWTITSVDDYLDNSIKKHELTRPERERVLADYLQQTGIDSNPVLITYQSIPVINQILLQTTDGKPQLSFSKQGAAHELWNISDEQVIQRLVDAFQAIDVSYIADGHHRAAAAALLATEQRKLSSDTSDREYNYFSSVYMATDQLKIYPFHRLVKSLNGLSPEEFISSLRRTFSIELITEPVIPADLHVFGLYLKGQWYKMNIPEEMHGSDSAVEDLDVTILQDYVLSPLLGIEDPRTDARISFAGGLMPMQELVEQVDNHEYELLFTLHPSSIDQLIKVASAGEVMPPKSTWFEPKFQVGLLIHQIH